MSKQEVIVQLTEIASNEGKSDPETAHKMAIGVLLTFLESNDQADVATAYRLANSHYWGDDYGEI